MNIEIQDDDVKYVQVIPGARNVEKSRAAFGYLAVVTLSVASILVTLL